MRASRMKDRAPGGGGGAGGGGGGGGGRGAGLGARRTALGYCAEQRDRSRLAGSRCPGSAASRAFCVVRSVCGAQDAESEGEGCVLGGRLATHHAQRTAHQANASRLVARADPS